MSLYVNEIFYSLQGEGGRSGEASIFIRLTGCNLQCDFCDTDFATGSPMNPEDILQQISEYPCQWIIWTGGEPTLQLTEDIITFFKNKGYKQAIESNGILPISPLLDYVVCSPKKDYAQTKKNNPFADEIRIPVRAGEYFPSPEELSVARHYFLSPVFSSDPDETDANIRYCVEQIKLNPVWKLSLQIHKLIGIA